MVQSLKSCAYNLCLLDLRARGKEEYVLGVLGSAPLTPLELRGDCDWASSHWPSSSDSGLTSWLSSYALSLEIFTEAGFRTIRDCWNIPGI